MNCKNRQVFIGDNLPILRGLNDEIADLIATDPPWNKEQRFNHPFGTNPKDRKEEMRTASVYYGDCLKHLTHWNN